MKRLSFLLPALDLLVLIALSAFIIVGVPEVPLHGDESTLIYTTRDYFTQFVERNLGMVTYNGDPAIDPMDQNLRLLDGRVHKYLGGFLLHQRGYTVDDLNSPWDWCCDLSYNQQAGHLPAQPVLVITRTASAAMMIVGLLATFGIGMHLEGRVTAYTAAFLFAFSPALLLNGRRSMMEGSLMGFSTLTVLAGLLLIKRRKWWAAVALGLSAGFALSSKHTAVLTVGLVFAAWGMMLVWDVVRRTPRFRSGALAQDLVRLSSAGLIAVIVFYALNPAWWGDPFGRAREVAALRTDLLTSQTQFFGKYADTAEQLNGFIRQVVIGQPQFYEVASWRAYIADQISAYQASPFIGITLGGFLPGLALMIVLLVLGLWGLVRGKRHADDSNAPMRWLVAVWVIGITLIVFMVTPMEWQRYYLPVLPAWNVVMGIGAARLAAILKTLRGVRARNVVS